MGSRVECGRDAIKARRPTRVGDDRRSMRSAAVYDVRTALGRRRVQYATPRSKNQFGQHKKVFGTWYGYESGRRCVCAWTGPSIRADRGSNH